MRIKYPIEYELNPTEIDKGTQWLTLKLKNIGGATLKELDVQLHSLDTLNLSFPVYGTGHYIAEFKPGEEREVVFRVNAYGPASVYATSVHVRMETISGGNPVVRIISARKKQNSNAY